MQFYKCNIIMNNDETSMFNISYPLSDSSIYLTAKVDGENNHSAKTTTIISAVIFDTTKLAVTLKVIAKKQKRGETMIEFNMYCFCNPLSHLDNEKYSSSI